MPARTRALQGRVIKSFGNRFIVLTPEGTLDCGLRGRFRLDDTRTVTPVAVGDHVELTVDSPPYGVIESVLPRRNKLSRPDVLKPEWEQVLIANCDQLVVVASMACPRLRYGAVDRFLLAGEKAGLKGIVLLNKIDLVDPHTPERAHSIYVAAGYDVLLTSAVDGRGVDSLRQHVQLKTSIFVGHSGVGKSSLLNALQPGLGLKTQEVSKATERGTHTTIRVELHPLTFGGYIADSPGLRAIGLWDMTPGELPSLYPDFVPYLGQCRFANCLHIGEPGCSVKDAVARGQVCQERYNGYLRIRDSLTNPSVER